MKRAFPGLSFRRRLILLWLSSVAAAVCAESTTRLRVIGERVNLRAAAGTGFEVVAQVSDGDVLEAIGGVEDEWVRVVPPASVDLWVFSDLVEQDRVRVSRAQVRAGPGLNYQVVGQLERGAQISHSGQLGDWLQIKPPPGATLWIAREFVAPFTDPPPPAPAVTPPSTDIPAPSLPAPSPPRTETEVSVTRPPAATLPEPQPTPPAPIVSPRTPEPEPLPPAPFPRVGRPVAPPPPTETPRALSRHDLVLEQQQGEFATFEGVLRRTGWALRRPSRYRLVAYDRSNRPVTTCYVIEREAQLDQLIGQQVRIDGRVFWIRGVAHPVVAADRLVRLE